ncbi:MAG: DSD1 family PLP-dependent enzyme [Burkholderiales bacterium]|nr:DSD1 family PLP-dependent enzyme [Burkholderiales bacterium]
MTRPSPARVGQRLDDIDTPALLLDLDAFEHNLDALDRTLAGRTIRVRPHAKSHKCPDIARIQVARGAVGVCCQKVSEAEVLVEGGIEDVLISNEVVSPAKIDRVVALARRARIGVLADHPEAVDLLAAAAAKAQVRLDVLVEVDVGAGRCGTPPGEPAAALAARIAAHPSLRFAGIHAYQGAAQHLRAPDERRNAIAQAVDKVHATLSALRARGLDADVVTGAGTGTYPIEAASGVYTELQPGSYIFMDADYGRNLDAAGESVHAFRQSLFLLATVMSRPTESRAVVDVGLKAHSVDSGMPLVADLTGAHYTKASDEHGVIEIDPGTPLPLGSKIRLIPGHCDPTVNLHDWLVCLRGDRVEAVWPISGRGAFS